jgi:hypothetical protein
MSASTFADFTVPATSLVQSSRIQTLRLYLCEITTACGKTRELA